jgi:hypothetical protein
LYVRLTYVATQTLSLQHFDQSACRHAALSTCIMPTRHIKYSRLTANIAALIEARAPKMKPGLQCTCTSNHATQIERAIRKRQSIPKPINKRQVCPRASLHQGSEGSWRFWTRYHWKWLLRDNMLRSLIRYSLKWMTFTGNQMKKPASVFTV